MKKILLCLISIFCLVGCSIGPANTPSKAVEEYLDRYVHNDDLVMNELDEYVIDKNYLKDEYKDTYKEVLKKQYSDLKYEITDEKYDGDIANVTVKITVYDLYKVQKDADEYLANHSDEFKNAEGNYDSNKFMKYKLSKMKDTTETIDYTLNIKTMKTNNKWEVEQLSNEELQKINGVYNYETNS